MGDKEDKHENPVEAMLHEMKEIAGYRAYCIVNGEGIVLKYEGFEVSRARALIVVP